MGPATKVATGKTYQVAYMSSGTPSAWWTPHYPWPWPGTPYNWYSYSACFQGRMIPNLDGETVNVYTGLFRWPTEPYTPWYSGELCYCYEWANYTDSWFPQTSALGGTYLSRFSTGKKERPRVGFSETQFLLIPKLNRARRYRRSLLAVYGETLARFCR